MYYVCIISVTLYYVEHTPIPNYRVILFRGCSESNYVYIYIHVGESPQAMGSMVFGICPDNTYVSLRKSLRGYRKS